MSDDTSRDNARRNTDLHVLCTTPTWVSCWLVPLRGGAPFPYADRVWGFTATGVPMIVSGDHGRLEVLGGCGEYLLVPGDARLQLHDSEEAAHQERIGMIREARKAAQ